MSYPKVASAQAGGRACAAGDGDAGAEALEGGLGWVAGTGVGAPPHARTIADTSPVTADVMPRVIGNMTPRRHSKFRRAVIQC